MPRVIAYTFEADVHCADCAVQAAAGGRLAADPGGPLGTDEHGLPFALRDREGNPVHPVFSTDEAEGLRCGCCGAPLAD